MDKLKLLNVVSSRRIILAGFLACYLVPASCHVLLAATCLCIWIYKTYMNRVNKRFTTWISTYLVKEASPNKKERRKRGKHLSSAGEIISGQSGGAEPDHNLHQECCMQWGAAAGHWWHSLMAKHHLTQEMEWSLSRIHELRQFRVHLHTKVQYIFSNQQYSTCSLLHLY